MIISLIATFMIAQPPIDLSRVRPVPPPHQASVGITIVSENDWLYNVFAGDHEIFLHMDPVWFDLNAHPAGDLDIQRRAPASDQTRCWTHVGEFGLEELHDAIGDALDSTTRSVHEARVGDSLEKSIYFQRIDDDEFWLTLIQPINQDAMCMVRMDRSEALDLRQMVYYAKENICHSVLVCP